MTLRIYNTLSRQKEAFQTIEPGKVRMYVCGPTVYAKAHIGHAMSALVFDIARRYLEFSGYEVRYVMNFTDVDDKIIARANEMGKDPYQLADQYIHDFEANLAALNIMPATVNPRATGEMDFIIDMIARLMEDDAAYEKDGDVYFKVENDPDYGKLSGRKLETMNAGARIQVDERKENPMDFALWKSAKPGEPAWESPWGLGRPGWHIECSAMNLHHLGAQIDIHGGGNDLIFPHHENEIAQTETLTHEPFARYWMHNGMLVLKGEKMSKSTGNLITIDEFLESHTGDIMRLMVINAGYRSPLIFNEDVLDQTERAFERLMTAKKPARLNAEGLNQPALDALTATVEKSRQGFLDSMDDDFNTAGASGFIYDLVRAINQARADGASAVELEPAQKLFEELTGVLGLQLEANDAGATSSADPFIALLIKLRSELRTKKEWELTDLIRDELKALGVLLEDGKDGTTWRWE